MPGAVFVPAQLNDLSVDVSVGAPAQGAVFYRGASTWNALAAGTSGQVLTSGGAGANPSWQNITPGMGAVVTNPSTSAQNTIQPTGATVAPLTIKGAASQTAGLLSLQNSSGAVVSQFSAGGALQISQDAAAFGGISIYTSLILGSLTGADALQACLYAVGRFHRANAPFTGLSGYDDTVNRFLYFGGGGWNVPDATRIEFWTAPTYNETINQGVRRLLIQPNGMIVIGTPGSASGTLYVSSLFPTQSVLGLQDKAVSNVGYLDCYDSGNSDIFLIRPDGTLDFWGNDSTSNSEIGRIIPSYAVNTHATRQGRIALTVAGFNGNASEGWRVEGDGSAAGAKIAAFGGAAVVQQPNASQAAISAVTDANAKSALQAIYNLLHAYNLAPATV